MAASTPKKKTPGEEPVALEEEDVAAEESLAAERAEIEKPKTVLHNAYRGRS